jgi:ATP-dependent DNA helicase RecG
MPPSQSTDPLALTDRLLGQPGVGEERARALADLGLTNIGKLIDHLPHRHERLEAEAPIQDLAAGGVISARGQVTATRVVRGGGRRARFEAVLHDGQARLDLVWFNATYLHEKIHPGVRLRVQGKAKRFGYGLQLANPTFELLGAESPEPEATGERLRPIYPASEHIPSKAIEQLIGRVLPRALPLIEDHWSEAHRRDRALPSLAEAYRMQHAPAHEDEVAESRRRFAYDELILLQLAMRQKRRDAARAAKAHALPWSGAIDRRVRARLPFALTPGQDEVIQELVSDLGREIPANRLIQGDVGSGKTVVALYAMLLAIAAKHQAALLAPTELLAEQHHALITTLLRGSKVRVALVTGSLRPGERAELDAGVASGRIDLIIGTHALLTDRLAFSSLAVAVIDEQHRFGVRQRAKLRDHGARVPHMLVMTATPIPRTLGLTIFGDLEISTIRGLPPGRTPVVTSLVDDSQRERVFERLLARLVGGDQAFIVSPTIDAGATEAEALLVERDGDVAAKGEAGVATSPEKPRMGVRELHDALAAGPLKGLRLGVMHGRLDRATREATMERFRAGAIDALIATTIIEVGVDVPGASIMVIDQADRFGLAQLHQLRGRVGRGSKPGACVLIADLVGDGIAGGSPEPDASASIARERLGALISTHDGFELAQRDFELRGVGELVGLRQSGLPGFRVADLVRDAALLELARRDALSITASDPTLADPSHALLRRRLHKAYGPWLGLGEVA